MMMIANYSDITLIICNTNFVSADPTQIPYYIDEIKRMNRTSLSSLPKTKKKDLKGEICFFVSINRMSLLSQTISKRRATCNVHTLLVEMNLIEKKKN